MLLRTKEESMRRMLLLACLLLMLVFVLAGWCRAGEMTSAVSLADLDLPHCQAFADGKAETTAPHGSLAQLLGLPEATPDAPAWSIGPSLAAERHFRLAFTRPIALGTICTTFTGPARAHLFAPNSGAYVSYLKPEAPLPGDVTKDDQWVLLPPGEVKTLPVNTTVRAVRFTWRGTPDKLVTTGLTPILLFRERYYNAVNLGRSQFRPRGKGSPDLWLGAWAQSQPLVGLVALPLNVNLARLELLKATSPFAPDFAAADQWQKLPNISGKAGPFSYTFAPAQPAKALRLTALQPRDNCFPLVIPLVALGTDPEVPSLDPPLPPYTFNYEMPVNGFVAIDITDNSGKLVRRLMAETPRAAGKVVERWDLKDAGGNPVPPGAYRWAGIARPPFTLTYETTVYNAGQPAWPAPAPGKGGGQWLGDHTCPTAACAVGDTLWFGCPVTESGHSIAVTDLEGNKVWHVQSLSGFHGADRIITDGKYAYLINSGLVQRVDPARAWKRETLLNLTYDQQHPSSRWNFFDTGAAVRDNKLYLAFTSDPVSWLQPSFLADTLEPTKCDPLVYLKRGNGKRSYNNDPVYGAAGYDELMQLYAAFLLDRMPANSPSLAGIELPSSEQAYFGDAPEKGALAGTLTAVFKEPIPLGSLLLPDATTKVYALKPGATLATTEEDEPGEIDLDGGAAGDEATPFDPEKWTQIPVVPGGKGRPALALAPEKGLRTTALRFQAKRVTFCLPMARRFEDIAPQAEVVATEGTVTPKGGWSFKRAANDPLTPYTPACMALVWKQEVTLRGVSLIRPITGNIAVDIWTGPAGADPKTALTDDAGWQEIGRIKPVFIQWVSWPGQPTVKTFDFGALRTTRAVRVRFLRPGWCLNPYTGDFQSVPPEQHAGGVETVVAYRYLGGDPEQLPVALNERITEIQLPADDATGARVLRHLPFPKPGNMAVDGKGMLHVVSDGQVVTVPLADGEKSRVVIARDKLEKPAFLAFDAEGLLYVSDCGPKVVKVFNPATGALVRTIGTPGGLVVGPWDSTRFDQPTAVTVDKLGKVWVVDSSMQPKRITRFSHDGVVEKTFMGPTNYGGGGWMDPQDKSIVMYAGMKFRIDWPAKTWKMESLLFKPGQPGCTDSSLPERAVYVNGQRYLVGDMGVGYARYTPVQVICRERDNRAVALAAAGNLAYWSDIDRYPALQKAYGRRDRNAYGFVWSDRNGDSTPQVEEVQLTNRSNFYASQATSRVGDDLSFTFPGARLRPTEILPNGVPVYDMAKLELLPLLDQINWTTGDGRTFVIGNRLLAPDGTTTLWSYPDNFLGGFGDARSGFGHDRPAGVLNGELTPIGHFTLGKEELFVANSNQGDWFVYTGDGFLVGCIFGGPSGFGRRNWNMPDWTPGKVDLSDVRLPGEHYFGSVTKADDGKVYAIAGHNHISVVRVDGFEGLSRLSGGALTVTNTDLKQTAAWELEKTAREQQRQEVKTARIVSIDQGITVDGALDDWPPQLSFVVHDWLERSPFSAPKRHIDTEAAVIADADNLYVAVRTVQGMKNAGGDVKTLFKTGDCVDICLGLDPKADPQRRTPVPGDVRIVVARVKGEPVMVIYKAVVANAKADTRTLFSSPVGEVNFDVVAVVPEPNVSFAEEARSATEKGTTIEIAIPWTLLGVPVPPIGTRLRGDVGVIVGDEGGVKTVARHYWSGKAQTIISDVPSEARLAPALWGDFYVTEPDKDMKFGNAGDIDLH
jgi:hypothetical protein